MNGYKRLFLLREADTPATPNPSNAMLVGSGTATGDQKLMCDTSGC